jgi:molybdate transport system substrate-binding protein
VAPKASAQGDITIDAKTNWTSLLKGGRLAGDRNTFLQVFTPKKRCRKLVPGKPVTKTGTGGRWPAAHWRWSNVMKRRWALFTALTPSPAKVLKLSGLSRRLAQESGIPDCHH